ncbi:hypothetical protein K9M47_02080 [Candidatus Gracilibacteria bacterium]|nr:hypothetical protein [Candidatus Gracilibacteria bacterium]MCF7898897.1 hypothetical protein [Candidatus Paceibacterota bacterium]
MIDTVVLLLPKYELTFLLGVSSWELYANTEQYQKFVRNPTKVQKETGRYFPRLTGYKRGFSQDAYIRVEFSVPKLIFLNNLNELEDKDFDLVIEILQERLKDMGVIASKNLLINAPISVVHFSKNILLKNGYTSSYILSEISKVNLNKRFDMAKTRFTNSGEAVYAHTSTNELVIYDKIADLKKDKKRAIDKYQTVEQRGLLSELKEKKELEEILRFEVRITKKKKLNKLLKDLGYGKDPLFKDVFNTEMSKKILNDYWTKIIKNNNLGIFSISLSPKDALRSLLLSDENLKGKQTIYFLGLFVLGRDGGGLRELRSVIAKRSNDRTWYRVANDMKLANELITKNNLRDWVKLIDQELENYKPYKINIKTYDKN